jgi:SAM-dependent methyltransferase
MDETAFQRLLSDEGQAALAAATTLEPTPANSLTCLTKLRKVYPASLATDALEMALLRRKGLAKFARAGGMYFTRESLEMASGELVANYRAKRFASHSRVLDLCCGIGADTLALAAAGCDVTAIDIDGTRLKMAEHNLAVYGLRSKFLQGDVLADALPEADAAFADPGRRASGQRYLALRDYLPPPQDVIARFPAGFPLAFKLAPGIHRNDLESLDGEIEFIEADGELKECVLWLGSLGTPGRRATLLASNAEPVTFFDEAPEYPAEAEPIGDYLYDPAAAVVRAGLVPTLGTMLDANPTDATVQMLSSNEHVETPFATAYRVEAVLTFDAKKVQAWLRSHSIGRVTVVKRGALSDASGTVEKWKLSGSEHRFLIITRQQGDQVAIVAERMGSA